MAAGRVGKIGQTLPLGMDIVPQSPTLVTTPEAEANMSFQALAEEKQA